MHPPANEPNDLERFFVVRTHAADVEGMVALYETNATLANGKGEIAKALDQIAAAVRRPARLPSSPGKSENGRLSARLAAFVAVLMFLRPVCAQAQTPAEALRRFVGVWDTEDTYYPASGQPSVERGVRSCRMTLRDAYLHCETVATNTRGVERTYWFLVNHNAVAGRYEMLSVWSNGPFKAVHALTPLDGARTWRARGVQMIGDTEENRHYSELVLERDGQIVWTGRRLTQDVMPDAAPISFVETWTRRAP